MTHPHPARRQRLAGLLDGAPVALFNGHERPRNYPGNPYPFRGDSHFLYFAGRQAPGAALLLEPGQPDRLFLEPVTLDESIWSGPGPSWGAVAEETGCEVLPLEQLPACLERAGRERLRALPTQDPRTWADQERLLGRRADPQGLDRDLARAIVTLRLTHDEAALLEIREACEVTAAAHRAALQGIRPGATTGEVLARLQAVCLSAGMTWSFSPILTARGERLHRPFRQEVLRAGELALIDFGAEGPGGFAGDVTQVAPVSGRFTEPQREIYRAVWRAHQAARATLRAGVSFVEVHRVACRSLIGSLCQLGLLRGDPEALLAEDLHTLFFPHGLGHLMGLDVHDMEDLGDLAGYGEGHPRDPRFGWRWLRLARTLEPGMVVTVEPGFYWIPELLEDPRTRARRAGQVDWGRVDAFREVSGIRLERDYLVTAQGAELLTPGLPETPEEVEALMGAGEALR